MYYLYKLLLLKINNAEIISTYDTLWFMDKRSLFIPDPQDSHLLICSHQLIFLLFFLVQSNNYMPYRGVLMRKRTLIKPIINITYILILINVIYLLH